MLRSVKLFLIALCILPVAYADDLAEIYGGLPSIEYVELSPEGEQLAFIQNSAQGINLIVYDLADMSPTARLPVEGLDVREVIWANEERIVLIVSTTSAYRNWAGGRYEYSAAYAIDLRRETIRQLVLGTEGVWDNQPGLGNVIGFDEDGDSAFMPIFMRLPNRSEVTNTLLEVSLTHGRGRVLEYGQNVTRDFVVTPSGEALARENYDYDADLYQLQVRGSSNTWRTVLEDRGPTQEYLLMGVMPDLRTPLVWAQPDSAHPAGPYTLNLETEELEAVDREANGLSTDYILTDRNRVVWGFAYSGVRPSYDFLDDSIDEAYANLTSQIGGATAWLESWSDDYQKLIFRIDTGMGGAGTYVMLDRASGAMNVLANSYSDISAQQTGAVYTIEYQARDGLEIEAVVTWPPGLRSSQRRDLPLVLLPHGGPASHDRIRFDYMAQYLARLGYAVLQPNFRGSTGYGRNFQNAGNGEWGRAMETDLIDGLDAMIERGWVDPNRVCIAGWSYGGYAALAGGAFHSDRFQCVVSGAGISDINQFLRDRRSRYDRSSDVVAYWYEVLGGGEPDAAAMSEISPASFASSFDVPVLLLHGPDDTVVDMNQSEIMLDALRNAGKDVTFVRLAGEDHWLSTRETRIEALSEMGAFINQHIGTPAPSE